MRILMLGNSLTTANDLPALITNMVGADVIVHARGGARLAEQLNPRTRLGALTQHALESSSWDYVVLQESSNGPILHRTRFIEASAMLCEQAAAAGASPIMFATWAYSPTCPKLSKMGVSREEMHELLTDAYHEAANIGSASVADVGKAFFEHAHAARLYRPDGVHPSVEGTALAANVIADRIARCLPMERHSPSRAD